MNNSTYKFRNLIFALFVAASIAACGTAQSPTTAPTVATNRAAVTAAPASTAVTAATVAPTSTTVKVPPTATTQPAAATVSSAAVAIPTTCNGKATVEQTEGPYYKANPPQDDDLTTATSTGEKIMLTGYVFDTNCKPLANARVDVWQADANGNYDNSGYNFRGYTLTDATGKYEVETVIPGLYPGRTRHIHVKVTPQGGATLTTQLYFPNVAQNTNDGIYQASTLVTMLTTPNGRVATYNFVVNAK